jgi:hypothetical protein
MVYIKKEGNYFKKFFKKWFKYSMFRKLNMFDLSLFKLTLFFAWLLIAKLFPIVLTAHIWRYIWIAALGAWYFSNMLKANIK